MLIARIVEARFDGGDITSDGGVLLLRQADRLTGLSDSIARALSDPRRQASCDHDVPGLVRQRLYAIALGYEDLNDHDGLRQDVALQTAVERDQWLASASTLCRFENRADRETAWRLHEVLLDQFIASLTGRFPYRKRHDICSPAGRNGSKMDAIQGLMHLGVAESSKISQRSG